MTISESHDFNPSSMNQEDPLPHVPSIPMAPRAAGSGLAWFPWLTSTLTQREKDSDSSRLRHRTQSHDASTGRFRKLHPTTALNPFDYSLFPGSDPIIRIDLAGLQGTVKNDYLEFKIDPSSGVSGDEHTAEFTLKFKLKVLDTVEDPKQAVQVVEQRELRVVTVDGDEKGKAARVTVMEAWRDRHGESPEGFSSGNDFQAFRNAARNAGQTGKVKSYTVTKTGTVFVGETSIPATAYGGPGQPRIFFERGRHKKSEFRGPSNRPNETPIGPTTTTADPNLEDAFKKGSRVAGSEIRWLAVYNWNTESNIQELHLWFVKDGAETKKILKQLGRIDGEDTKNIKKPDYSHSKKIK